MDVVIYPTSVLYPAQSLLATHPPLHDRVDFGDGLWIGKIGSDLAEEVFEACEAPGKFRSKPSRQYGELYSYCREQIIPYSNPINWDEDKKLLNLVCISKLVHPTSVAFRYSARIVFQEDEIVHEIYPGTVHGLGSEVWLPRVDHYQNWLTERDVTELSSIVGCYESLLVFPKRIKTAMWYYESAARVENIDLRWVMVCTSLESLVNTSKDRTTAQFTYRLSLMAKHLDVNVSKSELEKAYANRSSLVHGSGFPSVSSSLSKIPKCRN